MNRKPSLIKTLAWVYGAVAAFTAISIVGPILLDRERKSGRTSGTRK